MVPVVIVFAILGKAIEIMMMVAKSLYKLIPIDSIGQVAMFNILAVFRLFSAAFVPELLPGGKQRRRSTVSLTRDYRRSLVPHFSR